MSIATVSHLEAPAGGWTADDWAAALAALRAFIAARPGIRLFEPGSGSLNIRVRGETRGRRIADLDDIAGQWGADVDDQDGMLIMWRRFGPVLVEAHLCREEEAPVDADYMRAARARVLAQAVSPAASAA